MKYRDASIAFWIELHRWGLADNDVSSRKIRKALTLYQGRANRCNPRCSAGASWPSAAWL